MDRIVLKYLSDIHSSIVEIESFMDGRPREYATFCDDMLLRRGIERNIEIMGGSDESDFENVAGNSDYRIPENSWHAQFRDSRIRFIKAGYIVEHSD